MTMEKRWKSGAIHLTYNNSEKILFMSHPIEIIMKWLVTQSSVHFHDKNQWMHCVE